MEEETHLHSHPLEGDMLVPFMDFYWCGRQQFLVGKWASFIGELWAKMSQKDRGNFAVGSFAKVVLQVGIGGNKHSKK